MPAVGGIGGGPGEGEQGGAPPSASSSSAASGAGDNRASGYQDLLNDATPGIGVDRSGYSDIFWGNYNDYTAKLSHIAAVYGDNCFYGTGRLPDGSYVIGTLERPDDYDHPRVGLKAVGQDPVPGQIDEPRNPGEYEDTGGYRTNTGKSQQTPWEELYRGMGKGL